MARLDGGRDTKPMKNMEKVGNVVFLGSALTDQRRREISKAGSPNRPFVKMGPALAKHKNLVQRSVADQLSTVFNK